MKKLNIKMIVLSFVVTAVVLFGGWFSLQFFNLEKPITDWVAEQEGIKIEDLNIGQTNIYMEVSFDNQEDFAYTYIDLKEFLEKSVGGKKTQIVINRQQSELNPWWLEHSPRVMEKIENKQYASLPTLMDQWVNENKIENGQVLMNSEYIFIYAKPYNAESVYLIFPLSKSEGGGIND